MSITIYHNPRCSKSRASLELIRKAGIEPEIIEYLENPPDAATLRSLIGRLGVAARDVVRSGEQAWKDAGLDLDADEEQIVAAIASAPVILQRPIVVSGERAVIGRPPENVLALLG